MGLSAGSEVRSPWTRVALHPVTGVLIRDETETQTQRGCHVELEAETGGTRPRAQAAWSPRRLEEAGGTLRGARGGSAAVPRRVSSVPRPLETDKSTSRFPGSPNPQIQGVASRWRRRPPSGWGFALRSQYLSK